MLTQYRLALRTEKPSTPRPEWGYRLYASLLEEAPDCFGSNAHREAVTPLSQFLAVEKNDLIWTVNLLGKESEQSLSFLLDRQEHLYLQKDRVDLRVTARQRETVRDVDELFFRAARQSSCHLLQFRTATAFKSRGQYLNLPSSRLIIQGLIKKWNGCFPECPIEDEDGQGMDAIAAGLRCKRFKLSDRIYYLKGNSIPGFVGELVLENRLTGFHKELADALLLFSGYSGIGIKTALGMGGVRHGFITQR